MKKRNILLFSLLFSVSGFAEPVSYNSNRSTTGYLTRKLIKEYREIEKHRSYNKESNDFSTQERIASMREFNQLNNPQQQVNIQIPLIWYMEKF